MKAEENNSFVIAGAGNLAFHLASALISKGYLLKQVLGRTEANTKAFAKKFKAPYTTDLKKIDRSASFYLLCVNDDSLANISGVLKLGDKLVIHTSGSIAVSVLSTASSNTAVLYPLYTFTAGDKVNFKNVPVFVEGNNERSLKKVKKIAQSITNHVAKLSSDKRAKLHVAAVMTANFSNYLFTLANDFLKKEKAGNIKDLLPLINKTVEKLEEHSPESAQTGPARRHDKKVIQKHRAILRKYREQEKVYRLLSSGIEKRYNKKK